MQKLIQNMKSLLFALLAALPLSAQIPDQNPVVPPSGTPQSSARPGDRGPQFGPNRPGNRGPQFGPNRPGNRGPQFGPNRPGHGDPQLPGRRPRH